MKKSAAIILAAGQGKRMNSKVAKQFMMLKERPVLYYAIRAFEESEVDDIILVVSQGEEEYVLNEIVKPNHFSKVRTIVAGGKERYDSVYEGLKHMVATEYVLIHDGARPCITPLIINNTLEKVQHVDACIVGVPVKDTIKIVNAENIVMETPPREQVWTIQTPQAFSYELIMKAYTKLMEQDEISVTDDAMVVEKMTGHRVYTILGSYENLKITTPEDIVIAEQMIRDYEKRQQ